VSFGALLPLLDAPASTEAESFGRVPVVLVEIVQDFCTNTYGVNNGTTSFCTATGAAGTECFNTFKTCQDTANFRRGQKMVRFCKSMQDVPPSWGAIPSVRDVRSTPPRINAGGQGGSSNALGVRGTLAVTLKDHPSSDLALDPYVATRSYDPMTRGTFWTKWLARNTYFQNRPVRARFGYLGQDLEDMQVHYYVLDRVDGPDARGTVRLQGSDVLRLADDEKSQAPQASKGVLQSSLTNVATSFNVTGSTIAEYGGTSGTLRIRDEVMTYAGASEAAGVITFTSVTRGTDGTTAQAHNASDTVQRCLRYSSATPATVLVDLFSTWAGVSTGALDIAGWNAEATAWLGGYELTTLIAEPVGVGTLLSELCEQLQIMLWVDERTSQVKMLALRPPLAAPRTVNESSHILGDSQTFRIDTTQRFSQVWIWFNQVNPTVDLEDTTNYREVRVRVDADAESDNQYGEAKVRKIFSRWLKTGTQVNDIEQRILARFRDNPVVGSIGLDAKDRDLWTGQLVNVQSRLLTDALGVSLARQFQIVGAEEADPGHRIKLDLQSYDFGTYRVGRYMADAAPIYTAATEAERLTGAWYANDAGLMSDSTDGYTYQ